MCDLEEVVYQLKAELERLKVDWKQAAKRVNENIEQSNNVIDWQRHEIVRLEGVVEVQEKEGKEYLDLINFQNRKIYHLENKPQLKVVGRENNVVMLGTDYE